MRRPRIVGTILALFAVVVLAFIGLAAYFLMPGPKNLYTVSPETTFVTGPLDADGFVDNVAALNERLKGDIKPEQNANVLIWQAIGPRPGGNTIPPRYFELLGIPAPAENGEYFIEWRSYDQREFDIILAGDDLGWEILQSPWTTKEEPFLAQFVDLNKKPLEVFSQATKRTEFYHPIVPDTDEPKRDLLLSSVNSNLMVCKQVARLFVCRAMRHLGEGRPSEAWEDLLCCHHLGRILQKGGTHSELLIGLEIEKVAIDGEQSYLEHLKPTKVLLQKCRKDLDQLPPPPKLAAKAILSERIIMMDVIQHVAKWGVESIDHIYVYLKSNDNPEAGNSISQSIDWNATMRLSNSWFDQMLKIKQLDDYQSRMKQTDSFLKEFNETRNRLIDQKMSDFLPNSKTRGERSAVILVSPRWPSFKTVITSEFRTRQMAINLDVMLALTEYRLDRGRYPTELNELAPMYLTKVPNDIFFDEPLKYYQGPKSYILYSVGPNRVDEKGRCKETDQMGEDDVIIKVPREDPVDDPDAKD